jgi:hypothetical protein
MAMMRSRGSGFDVQEGVDSLTGVDSMDGADSTMGFLKRLRISFLNKYREHQIMNDMCILACHLPNRAC